MPEPGEDNLRLFDRINAAVVPHPQTPGIRRPGQETNIAPRPSAPGVLPEEYKGAAENRWRTACGSRRKAFSALLVKSISYAANDPSSEVEFFLDFGPGPPGFSLQSSQML